MKKCMALILTLLLAFGLCGCGISTGNHGGQNNSDSAESGTNKQEEKTKAADSGLKVGFLFPSDSNATDTISRLACIDRMQNETGLTDGQILVTESVKESNCEKEVAAMVDKGAKLIFCKAKGYEDIIIECARTYPDVQFCQEDGSKAEEAGLDNYHTYYTRLYEAYHVAGIAAGKKLVHMLENGDAVPDQNIGFVAIRNNPEAISCFTAFYTGMQRVYSNVHMLVRFVGSNGIYDNDGEAASQLAAANVCLMGQFVSTTAVAAVCAENDIPLVGNDVNLISEAPKDALTSAMADWSAYYSYAVKCVLNDKPIDKDWAKGYADNVNIISQLNDKYVAEGTASEIAKLEKSLREGKAKALNTEKMTIGGTSLKDLIKNDSKYKKYKKYVKDGAFRDSYDRSAPAFDLIIDGIEESTYDYLADQNSEAETTEEEEY